MANRVVTFKDMLVYASWDGNFSYGGGNAVSCDLNAVIKPESSSHSSTKGIYFLTFYNTSTTEQVYNAMCGPCRAKSIIFRGFLKDSTTVVVTCTTRNHLFPGSNNQLIIDFATKNNLGITNFSVILQALLFFE